MGSELRERPRIERLDRPAARDAISVSDDVDVVPDVDRAPEGRTSAFSGAFCRTCGGTIRGRRRNGFCSDRCRLRAKRAARRERIEDGFRAVERAIDSLKTVILPERRAER